MTQRFILILLILSVCFGLVSGQQEEHRGVWFAWAGSDVPSKEEIASVMDSLAHNGINVVSVDVWRYGFPYFRSQVFYDLTGLYTDPNLAEGRDVLADFIAEAHRVGIEVEAWFEAGFAASQLDNLHLFEARPQWFAQKRDGSYDFYANGGVRYRWLSHVNHQAQDFLIALCQEVARRYDVDGIELDRIRYPELDCGYDSATVAVYKSEHDGQSPPQNINDAQWIRWRADKLTEFIARVYDSVKVINPQIFVSNAPLWYGYEKFCQDYVPWIDEGHLDFVVPQLYYASNSSFVYRLDQELQKVQNDAALYPGISTVANGVTTPPVELIKMIRETRQRNLKGHVIWYHKNLLGYLDTLRSSVYQETAIPPGRSANWRTPAIIIDDQDDLVTFSAGWQPYSTIPGFKDGSFYTKDNDTTWVEYQANIPEAGWYELYVFIIRHWNAHPAARYQVFSINGTDTLFVNQALEGQARWYKLGSFYFNAGLHKILRLDAHNIGKSILFTESIMLSRSRQNLAIPNAVSDEMAKKKMKKEFRLVRNYPNPFNAETVFEFELQKKESISIRIFSVLGKQIFQKKLTLSGGLHAWRWSAADISSGVYFAVFRSEHWQAVQKVILTK